MASSNTGNAFLDGQNPGDIFTDQAGDTCEVLSTFGPDLSEEEKRRLRHDQDDR